MAPAVECLSCHYKAKTQHEPARVHERKRLMEKWAEHAADAAAARSFQYNHKTILDYHETTPATGFDKAEVVNDW